MLDDGSVTFTPGLPLPGYMYPSWNHWLGVEPQTGRDIFARLAYGARVSLTIAILPRSWLSSSARSSAQRPPTSAGSSTRYQPGHGPAAGVPGLALHVDLDPDPPNRLCNTFLGQGSTLPIVSLVMILGFFGWPYLARIVRGQVLSLREREFVESARAIGSSSGRIIMKEIIPNVTAVVLVYATLAIPTNITAEAALSFLGVGVRDPTPSWGQMLNQSQSNNWYQLTLVHIVPGVTLLLTVMAFNLLGDAVRDALDPRASRG